MNDIKQVTFFMEECRRMGVKVLGPDINESYYKFNVNEQKAIRFGMGAVKGVGRGAVQTIIEKRKDGEYKSIFDFAKRINLRLANKTTFENLILAGAFDSFNLNRSQYFNIDNDGNLAGACTTSGLAYKLHGRVGDSPIIGAGMYVDNEIGAVGATGKGEEVIKTCGSFLVVELMRQGYNATNATQENHI